MTYSNEQRKPVLLTPKELEEKISRLSQILEFENELLSLNSAQSMTENQSEKTRLVAIYNQQMTMLKSAPDHYKAYPKEDIDQLRETSQKFYEILDAHFRRLSTVKTVTEGIVKAVADEVAKKKGPPQTYNATASIHSSAATKNSRTLGGSISFNEVI
ncbi:hypothetical protein [Sneathiella limimaris]|uniref:hypothetical protein n=1 Tax=Sneathiella limimaris TaxID=1964213 RepID=UPI00146C5DAE|nr:hypothetical protein [Sneathiella limimaris]